jgi:hypothetical protein
MMQLQSPTYTKGIIESTILMGEPAIRGNPDMGVLQNGMAATKFYAPYNCFLMWVWVQSERA